MDPNDSVERSAPARPELTMRPAPPGCGATRFALAGAAAAAALLAAAPAGRAAGEPLIVDTTPYRVDQAARRGAYDLAWPVQPPPAGPRETPWALAFLVGFRDENHFHRVMLGPDGWRVERRDGDTTTVLERRREPLPLDAGTEFLLRRRRHWLAGLWGGRFLFRIYDTTPGQGTAGSWSAPPGLAGPPRFQAVAEEEMLLRDDFLRTPGDKAEGAWETAGQWALQSTADEWRGDSPMDPMNTARSPNPFVYRGTGQPQATALAGQPFWDDLAGTVSVRSQGGRAGWLFACRGPGDYHVLWWEPTGRWEQPSRFALERVRGGKTEVLAETWVPGCREQWYRLAVETRGPQILARLQGAPLLRATDPACTGGRVGLCAADGAVDFDDVDVHRSALRPFEESRLRRQSLTEPAGAWGWVPGGAVRYASDRRGPSELTFQMPGLRARRLAVSATPPPGAGRRIGLRFATADGAELVFSWDAADRWRPEATLAARAGTRRRVLARARGGFRPGAPLRLLVDQTGGDLRIAEVGAGLVLRLPSCPPLADRVGLLCEGGGEFRFEDLVLDGPDERDWERPVRTAVFVTDHYMLEWAAAQGEWVPDPAAGPDTHRWWHKGDAFGAVDLGLPLAAARQNDGLRVFLLAQDNRPGEGGELRIRREPGRAAGSRLSATLSWKGRRLAAASFLPPPNARALTVHRDGSFVWLECGSVEPFFVQLPELEPRGTSLGLELPDARWLSGVTVRRDHVVDEPFEQAAVRWRSQGRWEVSNKFHCDPRWAYMVGESDGLAALWHLDSFPGDLTLEFYAGMRYRAEFDFMPYYPRPGDINAVIAGSGQGVWDGYTAVVSGWDTTWTRLLRDGVVVAETDQSLVPSVRRTYHRPQDLHRRWFYVKLRRTGPRVEVFFENRPVLVWDDARPLEHGRIGLWTVDNSILVARARISYRRKVPFAPAASPGPPPALPPAPPPGEMIRLSSDTHPGCRFTFDTPGDLEGWQETGSADDARLAWDARDGTGGHGSLRLANGLPGGRCIARVPVKGLELRRADRLAFDWRPDPSLKVNLYLRTGGQNYVLRLTGPDDTDETLQDLGRVAVRPERTWQHVEFPLGRALAERRPADPSLVLDDLYFGVERGGYLLAGLGGNPGGAYALLDNFEIVSEGPEACRLRVCDGAGAPLAAGVCTIVADSGAEVCTDKAFSGGAIAETLPPGAYLVRAARAPGAQPCATLRLRVAPPPAVQAVEPEPGAEWGGSTATVRFEPGGLVPAWAMEFSAAGKTIPLDGGALRCDVGERTLTLDAAAAGLELREGESCPFVLRTRQPPAVLKEWALVYRRARDRTPPGPVRLNEILIWDTFEAGLGAWTRIGRDAKGREHGARLIRDDRFPASGRYSLKLLNELVGGLAGARITGQSFNAGRHRLLSFDCRMDEEMLIDLLLAARGMECRVTLTDNDYLNAAWPLGAFRPEFRPDGTWQRVEVDLHEVLQASPWVPGQFDVSNLRLGDGGWTGNRQGAAFWVDNVVLGLCCSAVGEGVALSWTASDPGGIAGYSCHWSRAPREDPPAIAAVEAAAARFRGLPEGRLFFHIRAADMAGNWGETTDWPFVIDNTPPTIRRLFPEADCGSADRVAGVELEDPIAGVDPASLTLTLNGRTFAPGQPGVELDLARGRFCVNWVAAGLAPPPEGKPFEAALAPVRDFAGNTAAPVRWGWRFAPAEDRLPPPAPALAWAGGRIALQITADQPQPALSAAPPVWVQPVPDPDRGSLVQRVLIGGSGIDARVGLPGAVDAATYRWLSFRYRFPPGLKIDLAGYLEDPDPEKQQMVIKLTDADVRPDYVTRAGRVEGILCDDRWHAALVDLKTHVEQREHLRPGQKPASYAIRSLAFADVGFNRNESGTVFYLDDVAVFAPGPAAARFSLAAADESGITGFACSFDRDPDGTPPREANAKPGAPWAVTFPDKGLWYVHACAVDGAGNWSAPAHFAYVVE